MSEILSLMASVCGTDADMPFIITDEKIRDALYEKSKQNALKTEKI
jgi:hypothetical protein